VQFQHTVEHRAKIPSVLFRNPPKRERGGYAGIARRVFDFIKYRQDKDLALADASNKSNFNRLRLLRLSVFSQFTLAIRLPVTPLRFDGRLCRLLILPATLRACYAL
jgi:hypothetical protein